MVSGARVSDSILQPVAACGGLWQPVAACADGMTSPITENTRDTIHRDTKQEDLGWNHESAGCRWICDREVMRSEE